MRSARGDFSGLTRSADRPARSADQLLHRAAVSEQPASRRRPSDPLALKLVSVLSARQCRAESFRHHADDAQQRGPGRAALRSSCSANATSCFAHYARSVASNVDPLSIAGANVPGFPVGEDIGTHSATLSETHLFSGATVNVFARRLFPQCVRHGQAAQQDVAARTRFQLRQHARCGAGPAVPHRERVRQHRRSDHRAARHRAEHVRGLRLARPKPRARTASRSAASSGATQINMTEGIASNGFFVFAPFPASDSFASFLWVPGGLLPGRRRHESRVCATSISRLRAGRMARHAAADPELRAALGSQHAVRRHSQPDERLVAGQAVDGISQCARRGCCSRAIPACRDGIAPVYWKGLMPRLGLAWDPTGSGRRPCAPPTASSTTASRTASAGRCRRRSARCRGRRRGNCRRRSTSPIRGAGRIRSRSNSFPQPTTVLTVENGMRPPYAQKWNFRIQRSVCVGLSARRSLHRQQGDAAAADDRGQSRRIRPGRDRGQCGPAAALCGLPRRLARLAISLPWA